MDQIGLLEEAENCRRKALAYLGLQEAVFLVRVAKAFEELDAESWGPRPWHRHAMVRDRGTLPWVFAEFGETAN